MLREDQGMPLAAYKFLVFDVRFLSPPNLQASPAPKQHNSDYTATQSTDDKSVHTHARTCTWAHQCMCVQMQATSYCWITHV